MLTVYVRSVVKNIFTRKLHAVAGFAKKSNLLLLKKPCKIQNFEKLASFIHSYWIESIETQKFTNIFQLLGSCITLDWTLNWLCFLWSGKKRHLLKINVGHMFVRTAFYVKILGFKFFYNFITWLYAPFVLCNNSLRENDMSCTQKRNVFLSYGDRKKDMSLFLWEPNSTRKMLPRINTKWTFWLARF